MPPIVLSPCRQKRPGPHVGVPTVSWQELPSVPGPAFMHAKAVWLWGQHVCDDEHSHGSWLQGVGAEPPLLLEQAATRSESKRTEGMAARMGSALTTVGAPLDRVEART